MVFGQRLAARLAFLQRLSASLAFRAAAGGECCFLLRYPRLAAQVCFPAATGGAPCFSRNGWRRALPSFLPGNTPRGGRNQIMKGLMVDVPRCLLLAYLFIPFSSLHLYSFPSIYLCMSLRTVLHPSFSPSSNKSDGIKFHKSTTVTCQLRRNLSSVRKLIRL